MPAKHVFHCPPRYVFLFSWELRVTTEYSVCADFATGDASKLNRFVPDDARHDPQEVCTEYKKSPRHMSETTPQSVVPSTWLPMINSFYATLPSR